MELTAWFAHALCPVRRTTWLGQKVCVCISDGPNPDSILVLLPLSLLINILTHFSPRWREGVDK